MKNYSKNKISSQIIDNFGTVTRFAKINSINIHTLKQVIYGYASSQPILDKLEKAGIDIKPLQANKKRVIN